MERLKFMSDGSSTPESESNYEQNRSQSFRRSDERRPPLSSLPENVAQATRRIEEIRNRAQDQTPDKNPPSDETETITAKAEGGEVNYEWPKSDEGKINRMRDILALVEKNPEQNGGASLRLYVEELELVINALISERNPDNSRREEWNKIGIEMMREYRARMIFHNQYLQFSVAGDGDKVSDALRPMLAGYLNLFFKEMPEVWEAFKLYETKAPELLSAQGWQVDEIKKRILGELQKGKKGKYPVDFEAAQRIAERLWQITARKAIHNCLVDKNSREPVTDEKKKRESNYEVAFVSDDPGGSGQLTLLRLLKFQDWLCTKKKDFNISAPQINLLDDVKLGGQDFFSFFAGKIEDYYEKILYEKYKGELGEAKWKEAKIKSQTNARQVAEILTGVQKDPKYKDKEQRVRDIDKVTGEPAFDWPSVINISGFKWNVDDIPPDKRAELNQILGATNVRGVDFDVLGEKAMESWSVLKVRFPDGRRAALAENENSFIRNPNEKALFELNSKFATEWESKEKLLENFAKLAKSKEYTEIGKPQYTREGIIALLNKAAGIVDESQVPFIKPQDKAKNQRNILHENFLVRFVRSRPVKFAYSFIYGLLWGLIEKLFGNILKQ